MYRIAQRVSSFAKELNEEIDRFRDRQFEDPGPRT
jgi:hypothetical protein